jgi:hypothetical protein
MAYLRVWSMTILLLGIGLRSEAAIAEWDANEEPDVLGYLLSYGTQPGMHETTIDVGNVVRHEFFPPVGYRYYIVVQAYNAVGIGPKSTEAVLDLTVTPNQPPSLAQPNDQASTVNEQVFLSLSATDPEGGSLTFSASGLPAGLSVQPFTGVIGGAATVPGTYTIAATVSDGALSDTASFKWSVIPASDTAAPMVSITGPLSGAEISKKVTLTATASDAGGVAGVRFFLDGAPIGVEDTTAPFAVLWNSVGTTNGTHQLTAVARDHAGNQGLSQPIAITVRNRGRR